MEKFSRFESDDPLFAELIDILNGSRAHLKTNGHEFPTIVIINE